MSELINFPFVSQRDKNVNADFDCVPACLAACLEFFTGKSYTAGEIKNAVYGAEYQGGTDITRYVEYANSQGCTLAAKSGNGSQLVQDIHALLQQGMPIILTEPDPYLSGWLHCVVAYADETGGEITALDPWIDQPVSKSNASWAQQLQTGQIWAVASKVPETIVSEEDQLWGMVIPKETGIYKAWLADFQKGKIYGAPLSHEVGFLEYIVQSFEYAYCRWERTKGGASWYDGRGLIK